jgi:glucans biosynthesis protein C
LRVFAVYLLFAFHTAKVYDPTPWYHVWSPDLIPGIERFTGFVHLWHMPLLFLLAGWSLVASVRTRGGAAFVRERGQRLGIPLLFGCVVLCPVIKYVELRSGVSIGARGVGASAALQAAHGALQIRPLPVAAPFDESFLAFLPSFYTSLDRFTWSHLWFVVYLLAFTLLYWPLLRRVVARAARPLTHAALWPWAPLVPLVLGEIWLRPDWPGVQNLIGDWANFAKYSLYLWAGVAMARHPEVEARAHAQWQAALAAGLALIVGLIWMQTHGAFAALPPFAGRVVRYGVPAAAGWCLVVACLGAAARWVRRGTRLLDFLSESAMPIYILHQLGVVLAAFFLDPLPLPVGLRLALVFGAALGGVLVFYAAVVRPFAPLRAAFGMKPRGVPQLLRIPGAS